VKLFTALFLSLVAVYALTMFIQFEASSAATHTIVHVATGEVIANPLLAAIMSLVSCLLVAASISLKAVPVKLNQESKAKSAGFTTNENKYYEVGWRFK